MSSLEIQVPNKLIPIFSSDKRFICLYGGRGSAKSHTTATKLLLDGMKSDQRILCTREIQTSIRDSVHKLISDKIRESEIFYSFYTIKQDSIVSKKNRSEFIFKGLYRDQGAIKSTEGIDICWVEEAQNVSRKSLDLLIPTIRNEGSQIIFTYNPTNKDDPVHTDYTLTDRDDVLRINVNYYDNPFFPDVLRQEMEWCRKTDVDKYNHVWLGHPVQHSEAQIFYGKWSIDSFETPENAVFYFGLDFGFSQDPTALVRCWVKDNDLYIDYEVGGIGVDIDKTPDLMRQVPGSDRWDIIADSSRPETISYLSQRGFRVVGAKKGKGSVEDGISKIRSFNKVIIHPRCKNTIDEFRLYCYKIDKLTDRPTPIPEDKHNHYIDALRYALENVGNKFMRITNGEGLFL